ncbi:hypothetical protein R1sor_018286 [Riccia sorocarpa]|uniref:Uncharacterized protein n=1 Tax=Riccia sorocarpa TaxID=122646 RepID=A0ABD3IFH8_9MARC
MIWHSSNRSTDGTMRLVSDSPAARKRPRMLMSSSSRWWKNSANCGKVLMMSSTIVHIGLVVTIGILMWTMHDYPGFGAISGFQIRACPTCAYMLPYGWSYELRKVIYLQYSTFLPLDHPFRGVKVDKNLDEPPIPQTMELWRARWDAVQTRNIQLDESGLRRWSILRELPY